MIALWIVVSLLVAGHAAAHGLQPEGWDAGLGMAVGALAATSLAI